MAEDRDRRRRGIGERIALLREAKGWNQEDLAHELHVSVATVSRWERGAIEEIRAGNLRKLAGALGVDVGDIASGAPETFASMLEGISTRLDGIDARLAALAGQLEELSSTVTALSIAREIEAAAPPSTARPEGTVAQPRTPRRRRRAG